MNNIILSEEERKLLVNILNDCDWVDEWSKEELQLFIKLGCTITKKE
jgi:hypothetical protein